MQSLGDKVPPLDPPVTLDPLDPIMLGHLSDLILEVRAFIANERVKSYVDYAPVMFTWSNFNGRVGELEGVVNLYRVDLEDGRRKWFATEEQATHAEEHGTRCDYLVWALGESVLAHRACVDDREAGWDAFIERFEMAVDNVAGAFESRSHALRSR